MKGVSNVVFVVIALLAVSCKSDVLEDRLKDSWVAVSPSYMKVSFDDTVELTSEFGICRYQIGHDEGSDYVVYGSYLFDSLDSSQSSLEILDTSTLVSVSDSVMIFSPFYSCSGGGEVEEPLQLINLDYFGSRVLWDSVAVTHFGDFQSFTKSIIRDELYAIELDDINKEIVVLQWSSMYLEERDSSGRLRHTIRVYMNGENTIDRSFSRDMIRILPSILSMDKDEL